MVPGLSNRICSQDQHADLGHISLGQQPILATMSWNVRNIVRHVRNVRNVGNVRNVPGPWEHCSGPTQARGGRLSPQGRPAKGGGGCPSLERCCTPSWACSRRFLEGSCIAPCFVNSTMVPYARVIHDPVFTDGHR